MKCNLDHSLWEKIKEVHLTTLIPLLTTALSISAVCSLSADDSDSIKLTNLGSGEIALWVSERQGPGKIKETVLKGNTGESPMTSTFTGRLGAVIAYADDHPPTLKRPVHWTKGVDTMTMALDNIHRIGLTMWVVNVGTSDFETIKRNALNANVRTSQIWLDERLGIEFSHFNIFDATKSKNSDGQIVSDLFRPPNYFANCDITVKGVGFTEQEINVYYVDSVAVDDAQGNTVVGGTFGEYCSDEHFIALGANSFEDLLVHELGHAFNLEHIDHLGQYFDQTNVMHPFSVTRNYLTEGQTFRAIADRGSAINNFYHTRTESDPQVECFTTVELTKFDCPPIQKQIWQDGGKNGEGAAQPKTKKDLAPHTKALQEYLDLDHEDVLGKAGHKKAFPQTMRKVMRFKSPLEPKFIRLLDTGVDNQVLQERERFLEEQWTRREAFLKKNPNLGLKKDDLQILRSITKQEYVNQGREQLIQRHQEKAIGALGAMQSPNANRALKDFRSKTENRLLKDVIDLKLPPETPPEHKESIAPKKPAGLRVQ